jgi:GNAT superfamily N-acetyltransferase
MDMRRQAGMGMRTEEVTIGSAGRLGLDADALTGFYNANWNRRIALGLPSFYRWQFLDAPASGNSDHCTVAVDRAGAILGIMGLNPRAFVLSGRNRRGAEMTTYVVDEGARGRGIGTRIMRFLQGEFDVLIGAGITPAAIPIYTLAGFSFIRALPRFVRIYGELPEGFLRATELGQRLLARKIERPSGYGSLQRVTSADVVHDHLACCNHYARNAQDLAWRYESHPVFAYEMYRVSAADDEAFLVLRFDDVGGTAIAHVMECFGTEGGIERATAAIDAMCLSRGVRLADFTCTATGITRFFRARGWFSILDDRDVQASNLFYPPEYRDPPTTSLMMWAKEQMTELLDTARLYVTKGDLDLDRPTLAFYEAKNLPT